MGIKKVDAGERASFEFSEWIVTSPSLNNLILVSIYRPQYSDEHRVTTNAFFTEFSNYLESILLSKEQLLITGDFNIHVDIVDDPDSLKLLDLLVFGNTSTSLPMFTDTHWLSLSPDTPIKLSRIHHKLIVLFRTMHRFFASYFMLNQL